MISILRPIFLFLIFSTVYYASMSTTINDMINKNGIRSNQLSILIRDAKTGVELLSMNADTIRKPASVMKVLTTYSAMLELGSDFRWPTKFYYHGRYHKGVIDGDLIVKAFGDPTLSSRDIPKIVSRLKRIGIKRITGNIVIDRSFFHIKSMITSGFDKNRYSEYNAMPDAMMFNDHLSKIFVRSNGKSITTRKNIPNRSYDIINQLQPSNKSCRGNLSWPRVGIYYDGDRPKIIFSGPMSLKCSRRTIRKLICYPYTGFFYALKQEMAHAGIKFHGAYRLSSMPASSKALFTHYSRPLLQIISKTHKKSNNLYARHIMLLLGAKRFGAPATEEKGRKAIREVLGIRTRGVYIDNGSGLSRRSRVTARLMSSILSRAYKRYSYKWMKTLSIAGIDGTIHKRFKHSIAKGRAWMKTGTLVDAKNIIGYVKAKSSKRLYEVVILYNGRERWKGSSLQNQIINWLAR